MPLMISASADLHRQLDALQIEPEYERRLRVLLEHCRRNLHRVDEALIRRAFHVAYWAHRNDRRASGELYISHPLEVALIAARDIRADDVTVAVALLHDTVEDTDLSLDLLRSEFGETVAQITDGVTKIGSVFENRALAQSENVRKLMLSMASDVRVILVKFADRLHNMRTLGSLGRDKQVRIATETHDLFAPLAHRFGLHEVKSELEDLSLKFLEPEAFQEIARGLNAKRRQRERFIERFIEPVRDELAEAGFDFEIYGRPKSIYSIYGKMRKQGVGLDEIYDLFAIRVILNTEGKQGREDCWRAYSVLTGLYPPIAARFRDFLSVPKSNGYQSLHTTVIGPEGRPVEIQIRTAEMHEIAERGVAAHWKYKETPGGDGSAGSPPQEAPAGAAEARLNQMYAWVRDLLENPRPDDAGEFVREFQLNLYDEEIYVFTPQGDLMTLPRGATPVDFAFQVHTEVGFHCIGAKVDGKMVPLSYALQSGEQVEILTSKKQTPNPDWVSFVVTHKASSRIRYWINERRRKAVAHGRLLLDKKLKRAKMALDEQEINKAAAGLKYSTARQLFFEIGSGLFDASDFVAYIRSTRQPDEPETPPSESPALLEVDEMAQVARESAREQGRTALVIDGERHTDLAIDYATCCTPVPGDSVFGFLSKTGLVKIHRKDCRNAPNLLLKQAERVIPVEWARQKDVQFVASLRLVGEDRVGIVSDITTVISKSLKTNIRTITVGSEDGMFEGAITLHVSDLKQLRRIMKRLERLDGIYGVYRAEE